MHKLFKQRPPLSLHTIILIKISKRVLPLAGSLTIRPVLDSLQKQKLYVSHDKIRAESSIFNSHKCSNQSVFKQFCFQTRSGSIFKPNSVQTNQFSNKINCLNKISYWRSATFDTLPRDKQNHSLHFRRNSGKSKLAPILGLNAI